MVTLLSLHMASLSLQTHCLSLSFSQSETLSGTSFSMSSLSTSSMAAAPALLPLVYCGRGDRRTAKGKRFMHSYGNSRPRNKTKGRGPPRIPIPPSPPKKDLSDEEETVDVEIDESRFS